jgi:RNA-directed DNA polymerase
MISNYKQQVRELLFKVLNRRSDRKSYTREGFIEMLKYYPLAMPKIYVSLF